MKPVAPVTSVISSAILFFSSVDANAAFIEMFDCYLQTSPKAKR
jgi:hypothetical protein